MTQLSFLVELYLWRKMHLLIISVPILHWIWKWHIFRCWFCLVCWNPSIMGRVQSYCPSELRHAVWGSYDIVFVCLRRWCICMLEHLNTSARYFELMNEFVNHHILANVVLNGSFGSTFPRILNKRSLCAPVQNFSFKKWFLWGPGIVFVAPLVCFSFCGLTHSQLARFCYLDLFV